MFPSSLKRPAAIGSTISTSSERSTAYLILKILMAEEFEVYLSSCIVGNIEFYSSLCCLCSHDF